MEWYQRVPAAGFYEIWRKCCALDIFLRMTYIFGSMLEEEEAFEWLIDRDSDLIKSISY